jgi:hypothetical protein
MEKNEIKKLLYKEKQDADFKFIHDKHAVYAVDVNGEIVNFIIPMDDMGTAVFTPKMEARYLIRWMKTNEEVKQLD